jgi:sugar phosphate isomerase/epimerase
VRPLAPANTRGGEETTPRLLAGISFLTFADLPAWSTGPRGRSEEVYGAIRAAGYEAIQTLEPATAIAARLIPSGLARIFDDMRQMREVAMRWRDAGCDCTTVQLGTGFESDDEMARLAESLLEISQAEKHPLFLETHRATMTQDIKRTLDLIARFPELRFNGDFGHWYIGHELTYGDMDMKFERMRPVFERTRFLHLRVSSNAFGQLTASDSAQAHHLAYYRRMWTASFAGFLKTAAPGDYIAAHSELLPARAAYPKMVPGPDGAPREESDRWTESAFLIDVARQCFAAAEVAAQSGASAHG